MPVYAVTGASGHLGRFAVQQLLARGVPPSSVIAVVRTSGKAVGLAVHISEVTGAKVIYRDLPAEEYARALWRAGLDEATARFVAAVDASIARGELETSNADLTNLLGRAATGLAEVVRAARHG